MHDALLIPPSVLGERLERLGFRHTELRGLDAHLLYRTLRKRGVRVWLAIRIPWEPPEPRVQAGCWVLAAWHEHTGNTITVNIALLYSRKCDGIADEAHLYTREYTIEQDQSERRDR